MNTHLAVQWARLADDLLSEAATRLEESRQLRDRTPNSLAATLELLKAVSCLRAARLVLDEADITLKESPKGSRAR